MNDHPRAATDWTPTAVFEEIREMLDPWVPDGVQVKMDRGASVSTLEIEIEIPNMVGPPLVMQY